MSLKETWIGIEDHLSTWSERGNWEELISVLNKSNGRIWGILTEIKK